MSVLAWILAAIWGVVLLAVARPMLRRLPSPTEVVPPYALWLPGGGEPPALVPAPRAVAVGPLPPTETDRILVLGRDVRVPPDLPGRLVACGVDFVSVLPRPRGSPLSMAIERIRREVARPDAVADPQRPEGFADARCAWLRRADLELPGEGHEPVLRAARARIAHAFPVELRDPRDVAGRVLVEAPGLDWAAWRREVPDLVVTDPPTRLLLALGPLLLCLGPLALLPFPGVRGPVLLALGLGAAAHLMAAVRDGFGWSLPLLCWFVEPAVGVGALAGARTPRTPFPAVDGLTASPHRGAHWLDAAALPFLARRLGTSALVLAQIHRAAPAGATALGRILDRTLHASPVLRALRHRRVMAAELARRLGPERLLCVPCGAGVDLSRVGAQRVTLVDSDPHARQLAARACPEATVVNGSVERAPIGPYDLVVFVGAAEHLDDRALVRQLLSLRARLAPDGALITSTTAEHPERTRADRWLGWKIRVRTPDALAALLDAAGYRIEARHADPLGIQWIFVARPRPTSL